MSAAAGRLASKVGQAATKSAGKAIENGAQASRKDSVLKKGAKRDPELIILLTIMTGAFGAAGYYFGRKPTSSSSEAVSSVADDTLPWQVGSEKGSKLEEQSKYRYHPGGDKTKTPKDAPSTISVVIVPDVTLPKIGHDRFNKWGKEGW